MLSKKIHHYTYYYLLLPKYVSRFITNIYYNNTIIPIITYYSISQIISQITIITYYSIITY